jgi:hypothetical protein
MMFSFDKIFERKNFFDRKARTITERGYYSRQKSIHTYLFLFRYEQEKFRIMIENGQLEKDKLQRESNWMEVQVQLAQTELALKKQECQEKGIIIQD